MFRRMRFRLLGRRRGRDAAYARPNLSRRTEASFFERLVRMLRGHAGTGYDDRDRRLVEGIRTVAFWAGTLLLFLFLARSALAFSIFDNN